jgi:hypothetical protein
LEGSQLVERRTHLPGAPLPAGPAPSTPTPPLRMLAALPRATGGRSRAQSAAASRGRCGLQGLGRCLWYSVVSRKGPFRTGTAPPRAFDLVLCLAPIGATPAMPPERRRPRRGCCGRVRAGSCAGPGLAALAPSHAPRTPLQRSSRLVVLPCAACEREGCWRACFGRGLMCCAFVAGAGKLSAVICGIAGGPFPHGYGPWACACTGYVFGADWGHTLRAPRVF